MKLRIITVITVIIMLFSCLSIPCFAASTGDTREAIKTADKCSLKATYRSSDNIFAGYEIEAFKVADVNDDFIYTLTEKFYSTQIKINGISSQSEWKAVTETVAAYITADKIEPDYSLITDDNGSVVFENLSVGIYYIRWTGNLADEEYEFMPTLVSLPELVGESWNYNVSVTPKGGENIYPKYDRYRVIMQWKDTDPSLRPKEVYVDIYRNGEYYDTVILTPENNWQVRWQSDPEDTWAIVERDTAKYYQIFAENIENTFVVTNIIEDEPVLSPKTGSIKMYPLYGLIIVSIISLGATLAIKRKYE